MVGDVFIGFFGIALLPWVIAPVIAHVGSGKWARWLLVPILVLEYAAWFVTDPSHTNTHMMGLAHRLTRDIDPNEIRVAAAELTRKLHDGTLKKVDAVLMYRGDDYSKDYDFFVDRSELPQGLQDKFAFVGCWTGRFTFAVNFNEGFLWSSKGFHKVEIEDRYQLGDDLLISRRGRFIDIDDGSCSLLPRALPPPALRVTSPRAVKSS